MATHVEIRKWLLDIVNRGELDGHFLHRPLDRFHLFCWATVSGEMDITNLASEAKRLWLFQFRIGAREEFGCRTRVGVECPERYRLLVSGQRVVQHHVELKIFPGSNFSERPVFEIVEDDEKVECPFRYIFAGEAVFGPEKRPEKRPIQGALDLM